MAWSDPAGHIYTTGEIVSAATMNAYVKDNLLALRKPPSCRAYATSTPTIATGTLTTLTFEQNYYDNAGIHVAGTDTFTAVLAGVWVIGVSGGFVFNATGDRNITALVNGTKFAGSMVGRAPNPGAWLATMCVDYKLALNDVVKFQLSQTSGGNLASFNAEAVGTNQAWMRFTGEGT